MHFLGQFKNKSSCYFAITYLVKSVLSKEVITELSLVLTVCRVVKQNTVVKVQMLHVELVVCRCKLCVSPVCPIISLDLLHWCSAESLAMDCSDFCKWWVVVGLLLMTTYYQGMLASNRLANK